MAAQTKDILERIDALLAKAGTDKTKLLSATIWLADITTFDEMNGVWDAWVPEGGAPARATVEDRLAAPQFTVEIGIIAARFRSERRAVLGAGVIGIATAYELCAGRSRDRRVIDGPSPPPRPPLPMPA